MGEVVGSPFQPVPMLPAVPSLRSTQFPIAHSVRQQQSEAFVLSNANTTKDGIHQPYLEDQSKETQFRQSTGTQLSTGPAAQLSLKLKISDVSQSRAGLQEDRQPEASTSSMTTVIQPAQRVVLASSVTSRGLPNRCDGLPRMRCGDVRTPASRGPTIASSNVHCGGFSTFPTCPKAVSEDPRPSSMSPISIGSKRPRKDADQTHGSCSVPRSSAVSHSGRLDSGTSLGETTPHAKRLRARLPCVDQYVALRKDLDVLLGAVAGGLSAQQGVIVAAALKEMAAR